MANMRPEDWAKNVLQVQLITSGALAERLADPPDTPPRGDDLRPYEKRSPFVKAAA